MALVLKDRVKETTTTTGTGTVTLAGAATGFQSFSVIGNANTTYYTIALQNGSEWEVGIGTYTASGTTLSRDTVLESSNSGSLVNFSAGTKDVFVTYPAERAVYEDANGTVVLEDNSANAALRITQLGSGNALLVEDSSNPDSTPFVIDAEGSVLSGNTTYVSSGNSYRRFQSVGLNTSTPGFSGVAFGDNSSVNAGVSLFKSRGSNTTTYSVVQSGDRLGTVVFGGSDGTKFVDAARIEAFVDGTAGADDMPGRLVFYTTADGAASVTERMRITSAGGVSFGSTGTAYGTSGQVLQSNGNAPPSWTTITAGDVSGPATATDNAIARYDGTTGKLIQNSAVTVDDTGALIARAIGASQGGSVWLYSSGATSAIVSTGDASTPLTFSINFAPQATITTNGGWSFGSSGTAYGTSGQVLQSNGDAPPSWTSTITSPVLATASTSGAFTFGGAFDEKVYAVVDAAGVAISPSNGTIQTWTLGANRTPTSGTWNDGESMTLMINDGSARTITWTTIGVTWVGGAAPTLDTTKLTVIELWKVGGIVYGALVGAA